MTKIKIILIALLILFLLGLVIFGGGKEEESKEIKMVETISPTLTLDPVRKKGKSKTGAQYISPTKEEKTERDQIAALRDKSPIETDHFKIDFSYKINLFVVEFKNKDEEKNMKNFDKWREENGYSDISPEYFKIEK